MYMNIVHLLHIGVGVTHITHKSQVAHIFMIMFWYLQHVLVCPIANVCDVVCVIMIINVICLLDSSIYAMLRNVAG